MYAFYFEKDRLAFTKLVPADPKDDEGMTGRVIEAVRKTYKIEEEKKL